METLRNKVKSVLEPAEDCTDQTETPDEDTPDDQEEVRTLQEKDLRNAPQTSTVCIDPQVLGHFIARAALYPDNEIGALALGRRVGRYLVIEDLHFVRELGTSTRVPFDGADFDRAEDKLAENQAIVGWFHTHPGMGVWMSATDVRHQQQGQGLFADYVALVVDPFADDAVEIGFFRVEDGSAVRVPYRYYGGEDGTR